MLRSRHTYVTHPTTGRRLSVLPDAYFEVTYADGQVQCAMLEIDLEAWLSGEHGSRVGDASGGS